MSLPLPFLFLDLETTGHEPIQRQDEVFVPWHEIIELAAVMVDQQSLAVRGEFSRKVQPLHPERCIPNIVNDYPARAARGEWAEASPLADVVRWFLCWIADHAPEGTTVPCGQNPGFDWSFLSVAFALSGITEGTRTRMFHYAKLDTRSMAVQALWQPGSPYDPDAYSLRNEKLAQTLGIAMEPYPHEALNGARQALAVFRALRQRKD
ncbi:MAG TPA: hypothetical protein VMJ72_02930 [Candidatus Paceibacterota bacterium]|nr:hypothetical protein [Candidatus Paceibacterota bacterium]